MRFKQYIKKHPVRSYPVTIFIISWLGAFAVVTANLLHHEPLTKLDGLLMFPAMIVGPPAASIILTNVIDGRVGFETFGREVLIGKFQLDGMFLHCLFLHL